MEIQLLNLLVPDELPTQHKLSEANKEKVSRSLTLTLQSLDLDCQEQAIIQVNQALTILGTAGILPNDFLIKGTKKYRDVLDYDSYFNINHVKSQEPEICLVRSIVVAYRSFLLLSHQSNKFNSENIEIQRQGFRYYFQLLSRDFSREEYEDYILPTMMVPHVQSDDFSGLMFWDHAYLMIIWKKIQPRFKNMPLALQAEQEEFVSAYMVLSKSHKKVCSKFGGNDIGSLRSSSTTAIQALEKFEKSRGKLISNS